jgi:hypothetical protein
LQTPPNGGVLSLQRRSFRRAECSFINARSNGDASLQLARDKAAQWEADDSFGVTPHPAHVSILA